MRIQRPKALATNQGFTLLELVVVVAVVGIFAAIAIQQFSRYRSRATDANYARQQQPLQGQAFTLDSRNCLAVFL